MAWFHLDTAIRMRDCLCEMSFLYVSSRKDMKLFTKNSQHILDPAMLIWADPMSRCPIAKRIWISNLGFHHPKWLISCQPDHVLIPSKAWESFGMFSKMHFRFQMATKSCSSCFYDLISCRTSWTGQSPKSMNQCGMPHKKNGDIGTVFATPSWVTGPGVSREGFYMIHDSTIVGTSQSCWSSWSPTLLEPTNQINKALPAPWI